ncbi:MAG: hypothetical protein ACFFHD_06605 [Promethearchaeota archaeon]
MKILNKIKLLERKKKISYLLLIIILLYGFISTLLFLAVSNSLIDTILSIEMPDDYFYINFNPSEPELEISFSITNFGFSDINDFSINLTMSLVYYNENNEKKSHEKIFSRKQNFGRISLRQSYYNTFYGDPSYFNKSALEAFWIKVNLNKSVYTLFDLSVSGRYYFNMVPFDIEIKNINITVF